MHLTRLRNFAGAFKRRLRVISCRFAIGWRAGASIWDRAAR